AAAVVMDAVNGEIFALASMPAFDPNAFSVGISREYWRSLLSDPRTPLVNKCLSGLYPPGSTFKMVVALAALDAGVVSPDETVYCSGRLRLGNHFFHCWKKHGHGTVAMMRGIVESCDIYFYQLALRLGAERIAAMARLLGLGQSFNMPIAGERAGLVPTPAWKRAVHGKPWTGGETLNLSIGQGYLLATPLQLAVMTARLASGTAVTPSLVGSPPDAAPPLAVAPEHLALIRAAMNDVVNAPRGTAHGARIREPGWAMAGKTGTAQVRRISLAEREAGVRKNEDLPWIERDHALFVGYAPVPAPRYAAAVVVEHGGGGASAAAPLARDILTWAQAIDPARVAKPGLADAVDKRVQDFGARPEASEARMGEYLMRERRRHEPL
ncbi:MAG: penicillin-binding protein 2, partial [Alphaproteobacteria bacterium]